MQFALPFVQDLKADYPTIDESRIGGFLYTIWKTL